MKVALTTGPGQVVLVDRPSPEPGPGEALVAVTAVGLCGTDEHIWAGEYGPSTLPLVQGHELAGTLVAAPAGYPALTPGTAVVINPAINCGRCFACRRGGGNACERMQVLGVHADGGLCEYLAVDVGQVHPADGLPPEHAALAEPASISLEAVRRAAAAPGDYVAVIGAGPIGLWAVAALASQGAHVAVAEPDEWRRSVALTAGAELAVPPPAGGTAGGPIREWAGDNGPAAVIEASGSPAGLRAALDLVRATGTVVMVGISDAAAEIPMTLVPYKTLDIRGSRNTRLPFTDAAAFVAGHRQLAEVLVTHRFPLEGAQAALELLARPGEQVGKVVLDVGGAP